MPIKDYLYIFQILCTVDYHEFGVTIKRVYIWYSQLSDSREDFLDASLFPVAFVSSVKTQLTYMYIYAALSLQFKDCCFHEFSKSITCLTEQKHLVVLSLSRAVNILLTSQQSLHNCDIYNFFY